MFFGKQEKVIISLIHLSLQLPVGYCFVEQDQDLCEKLGMPLGGKDSGEGETLARYLANQLSRRIQEGEIEDIEGAFLSVKSIKHLAFTQDVVATATEPFSLFRLKIE